MRGQGRHISWGQVALFAALLLAFAYTGNSALTGDRGLMALAGNTQDIHALEMELARLEGERERMARDVQLLSPPMVDRDLLDERARVELGFVRENEQVIFRGREE